MKCHICIYWTPEKGCNHYLPDSRTVIEMAGYTIQNLPDKGEGVKFKITKGKEKHIFESLPKAARVLIHDKK